MPRYSFDEKCYDLAKHFFPEASEADLNRLAQLFQDQVEMFEPEVTHGLG